MGILFSASRVTVSLSLAIGPDYSIYNVVVRRSPVLRTTSLLPSQPTPVPICTPGSRGAVPCRGHNTRAHTGSELMTLGSWFQKHPSLEWGVIITIAELYDNLQRSANRYEKFAGHCFRSEESVSKMILWAPKHGNKDLADLLWRTLTSSRKTQDGTLTALKQQCMTMECGRSFWIGYTTRLKPLGYI